MQGYATLLLLHFCKHQGVELLYGNIHTLQYAMGNSVKKLLRFVNVNSAGFSSTLVMLMHNSKRSVACVR